MKPLCWVIVSGHIWPQGGQDRANLELVRYLLRRGDHVVLVCHGAAPELMDTPNCEIVTAPRLLDSHFLSQFRLAPVARQVVRRVLLGGSDAHVIENGGIFFNKDINWMHCVHHAWDQQSPCRHESVTERLKHALFRGVAKRDELRAARSARLIIANSERTKHDIEHYLGINPAKVRTIYLGADKTLQPPTDKERDEARKQYGIEGDTLAVVFVGALDRDDHKGFACLFEAWKFLCARNDWNARLLVAGDGNQLRYWKNLVAESKIKSSITFLGYVTDIPQLLGAADLLVSPAKYEGYGLNVQEAICRGVPAFVSKVAGIAERYPDDLDFFLLDDASDSVELATKILGWRSDEVRWRNKFGKFSDRLNARTWQDMAHDIVSTVENAPALA